MKKIIVLGFFIWFCQCKHVSIDPYIDGKVTGGLKNNLPLANTRLNATFNKKCNNLSFLIGFENRNRYFGEAMDIDNLPYLPGTYKINRYNYYEFCNTGKLMASYATTEDYHYDVGKDRYDIIENEDNQLIITKIDTVKKIITGQIKAVFLLERDENGKKRHPDSADTLRFTNINFEVNKW